MTAPPPVCPPLTIADALRAAASSWADRSALIADGEAVSFAALHDAVRECATGLVARGVAPGERVAVWASNTAGSAVALLAVCVCGAAVVPLSTRYTPPEVGAILRRAGARLVLADDVFAARWAAEASAAVDVVVGGAREVGSAWTNLARGGAVAAAELAEREAAAHADDCVLVQFTSGTTGLPRGALLRQGPLLQTTRTQVALTGIGSQDVLPVLYPLAHVGGLKTCLVTMLVSGATAVMSERVSATRLSADIVAHSITVVNGPPTVYADLIDAVRAGQAPAPATIRVATVGAAAVSEQLVRDIRGVLRARDVIVAYGLSEASGVCTMTRLGDGPDLAGGTLGRPIDGVEVRIQPILRAVGNIADADGEIQVRGPNVMVGYLDDEDATAAVMDDGWLRTGDLGRIGADGYVRLTGRVKDMVVVGGFTAYPAEVERVIESLPGVRAAAVVGVPDRRLGEVTVAFVVLSPAGPVAGGSEPLGPDAVLAWCAQRLANYKVPRHVWIVDGLPTSGPGKVLKPVLRRTALANLAEGGPSTR